MTLLGKPASARLSAAQSLSLGSLAWPLGLAVGWVGMALAIDPRGDFPLNDDWCFALPVEVLLREGKIYFTSWQATTLIAQALWGALFCIPVGFSYTALRISTLTLGLVGILSFYGLLREVGAQRSLAGAGAVTLAINPLYLGLSYTFMSDIPFLGIFVAALFLVVRGLRRERMAPLLVGLLLGGISIFVRQLGLVLFLGLAVASLVKWGFGRRWLLVGLLPAVLACLSLSGYTALLKATDRLPLEYASKAGAMGAVISDLLHLRLGALKVPIRATSLIFMYVGLFSLPFLVLVWPSALRALPRRSRVGVAVGAILSATVVTAALAACDRLMPLTENLFIDFGLGIRSLEGPLPPCAPRALWVVITAASALGAAGLAVTLPVALRENWVRRGRPTPGPLPLWLVALLVAIALLYSGPICMMYALFFDRYIILLIILYMMISLGMRGAAAHRPGAGAWSTSGLLMLAWAYFAVGSTHDYLDWNRARWAACAEPIRRGGVSPEAIEGGFEFNNLHAYRASIQTGGPAHPVRRPDAPYLVAQGPVSGFEVVRRYRCHPWLPYAIPQICLLRRLPPEGLPRLGAVGDRGPADPMNDAQRTRSEAPPSRPIGSGAE